MIWVAGVIGFFIGGAVGIITMALMVAGKSNTLEDDK